MRLQRFKIRNFRSIKDTELSLLDTGITTLIGANGSGKSNVLKALVALAEESSTSPTDDEFHAQDIEDAEDSIVLEAHLIFEEKDSDILAAAQLTSYGFSGFSVRVTKPRGKESFVEFISAGPEKGRHFGTITRVRALADELKEMAAEPVQPLSKQEFISALENSLPLPREALHDYLADVRTAIRASDSDPDQGAKVLGILDQIISGVQGQFNSQLGEVFSKLSVELLLLNSYPIENRAPIHELNDREKHPFLFDLLVLSERAASQFSRMGLPLLSRVKDSASRQLSKAIGNVWPSHKLGFQIDRHADDLVFMVFTPQGHQVSLTDLSDGEQWFLKFYVRLAIAKRDRRQVLWLFDEPGRDLHTSSQIDLKRFFEDISQEAQIIYTSHLAMMMPWHRLERIFAIENSQKDGTIVHSRFWKDTDLDSPLKLALSTFVGEELIGGRQHVIVEGVSDLFFIQGWVRFFQRANPVPSWVQQYGFLNRILVPVDGIEKMPLYCWFLGRKVKKHINWVVIADSAKEAADTAQKMADAGLGAWTKNVKSIAELATPKKQTALEIEAIFTRVEYLSAVREFYSQAYPGCEVPSDDEVALGLASEPKLTSVLANMIAAKNPGRRMGNGKPIALDKTGVSQHIYKILSSSKNHNFSKETEAKFAKLLENIDRTFENEYDEH